jgi:hypothetical protein
LKVVCSSQSISGPHMSFSLKAIRCLLALMIGSTQASIAPACAELPGPPFATLEVVSDPKPAVKILLVGASLLCNCSIGRMLALITRESNPTLQIKIVEAGGGSYSFENQIEAGIARNVIESQGPWNFVILSENSGVQCHTPEAGVPAGTALVSSVRQANGVPILYEAWGDKLPTDYEKARAGCRTLADALHCDVLEVATGLKDCSAFVPGLPPLFDEDGHHLSVPGQFVVAVLLYAKVFGRAPRISPHTAQSVGLSPDSANSIASVASKFNAPYAMRIDPPKHSAFGNTSAPGQIGPHSGYGSAQRPVGSVQSGSPAPPPKKAVRVIKITSILGDTVMFTVDGTTARLRVGEQHQNIKLISIDGTKVKFSENGTEFTKQLF